MRFLDLAARALATLRWRTVSNSSSVSSSESISKSVSSSTAYSSAYDTGLAAARLGVARRALVGEAAASSARVAFLTGVFLTGVDLGVIFCFLTGVDLGVAFFFAACAALAASLAALAFSAFSAFSALARSIAAVLSMYLKPSLPPAALVACTSLCPLRRLGAMMRTFWISPLPLRTRLDAVAAPPAPVSVSVCASRPARHPWYAAAKWRPALLDLQSGMRPAPARRASRSK